MGLELITHKGVDILYIDFTLCKNTEEMLDVLEKSAVYHRDSDGKLRTLDNLTGMTGSTEFLERAKQLGKEVFREKTERAAIIGLSSLQKIMLNTYNLFVRDRIVPFDSKEEALEYLARE